jgi:hypothetical protein
MDKYQQIIADIIAEYGDLIGVEDLGLVVQGCILTHIFYNQETDTLHYFSGDIVEDKYAEELFPNEKEFNEIYDMVLDNF